MHVFWSILGVIGIILLVLLLLVLVLVGIVLFVPIRYRFSGRIDDPEGAEQFEGQRILQSASGEVDVRWLFSLLHVRIAYPSQKLLDVRLFGRPFPVEKLLHRKKKSSGSEEKKDEEHKEELSTIEKVEKLWKKVSGLWERLQYSLRVLGTRCADQAKARVFGELGRALPPILPRTFAAEGTMGLGDPYRSGKVMEFNALLYPFLGEQLQVGIDFDRWIFDIRAAGSGRIRLFGLVRAALGIIMDKSVRKVLRKLRSGPKKPQSAGKEKEQKAESQEEVKNAA